MVLYKYTNKERGKNIMIKTFKSRKQMERENFIDFDGTRLSRDEIVRRIKSLGYENFNFRAVAISRGIYGANGAVIDVKTNTDIPETITTFSILARNITLLEFV